MTIDSRFPDFNAKPMAFRDEDDFKAVLDLIRENGEIGVLYRNEDGRETEMVVTSHDLAREENRERIATKEGVVIGIENIVAISPVW